jgi:ABC-2 type transport system ATP-binding protein
MSVPSPTTDADRATSAGGHAIELDALTVRFGTTVAVDAVTTTIRGGAITGLLGRNGAGKSTMLATIAAYRRPTGGAVRVDGADPYEDARLMADLCLVRHDGDFNQELSVADTVSIAATFRPRWDQATAERLLDRFELTIGRKKVSTLSSGQRAALAVSIGIATRAPVTMLDEPHLGLDAPSRYVFYDELLASYMADPRTIIVSTHLIDEMASLFEDVLIIDHGRVLTHQPTDDLQARGVQLTGPADAVDAITAGMSVLSTRSLGRTKSAVVVGEFNGALRAQAAAAGVDLGPIPLQDLFVALTTQEHPDGHHH